MNLTDKTLSLAIAHCLLPCALVVLLIGGCARSTPPPSPLGYPKPYRINNEWYQPLPHAKGFKQRGIASWYGRDFHGKKTANGEIYNMYAITAAHKTLPFGTYVEVHNLQNNKKVTVRINDRGPFIRGRIIDLTYTTAKQIGIVGPGTARVEITALGTATLPGAQSEAARTYAAVDYYSGNFTIQVGAFEDRKNAERLKAKLAHQYKNAHIITYDSGRGTFYRVRVGNCSTLTQAIEYEKIMLERGFTGAFVVAE